MKTILFVAANPLDSVRLRLDEEIKKIEQGLERSRHRDQFRIVQKWAVTAVDLRRALLDCRPSIVHFSGHGSNTNALFLEDDVGKSVEISTYALAELFGLCAEGLECVVLNACYSEAQAKAIGAHVEHVVGMSKLYRG